MFCCVLAQLILSAICRFSCLLMDCIARPAFSSQALKAPVLGIGLPSASVALSVLSKRFTFPFKALLVGE